MTIKIKVTEGPAKGKEFTFPKADCFLFGRAKDARLCLPNDPYVSRQHFLIEISPVGCMVTDLGSKNGLFVNGVRYGGRKPAEPDVQLAPEGVMGARLKNGDQITVGNTVMQISIKTDAACWRCGESVSEGLAVKSGKAGSGYVCAGCLDEISTAQPDGRGSHLSEHSDSIRMLESILRQAAGPRESTPPFKGYRIENVIGNGNMGTVYKAVDELTGMAVAIKTMKPQLAAKKDNIQLFKREVEVTRQLKHKNIVEVYDYGKSGKSFFFVIEYVDGTNVEDLMRSKDGPLGLEEALPIMIGTLQGMAYAHRTKIRTKTGEGKVRGFTGIVHRDIKPENILLVKKDKRWFPKISDFGLSKSFESAGLSGLTLPGMVAGTPVYWPREQITHYRYLIPATDVFSLGAVFYEMLTGSFIRDGFDQLFLKFKRLGQNPGISDFMRVLAENPPIPIRERKRDIPGPIAAVIDRALTEAEVPTNKNGMRKALAGMRYADAGVFFEELVKALKKTGIKP